MATGAVVQVQITNTTLTVSIPLRCGFPTTMTTGLHRKALRRLTQPPFRSNSPSTSCQTIQSYSTNISNSYGVKLYSNNSFYPIHTGQDCGFCSTTSPPNFITTAPDTQGQVTMEFTQPASNLSFYFVGLDTLSGQFGLADIYVNGSFAFTNTLNGVFNSTGGFSLPSTTNITKIIIYGLTDPAGVGIDDLTFTIAADVKITNPRVTGSLNGTTQKALAGADVTLNASPIPAGFSGGSYSWSFTGPVSVSGGSTSSSSVVIRSTDVGTITARVNYTKNSATVTAAVTLNAVLPSLTNFSASMASDQVNRNSGCSFLNGATYTLGCWTGTSDNGIVWNSTTQIPSVPYLSNSAQSGVKFVQAISSYRKRLLNGNTQCRTARSSESNIASGWQLDLDPYITQSHPVRYFSEGNTLTMSSFDAPGQSIDNVAESFEAFLLSEYFETYVFYFTGNDPAHPIFQRAISLSGSGNAYARLAWSWGGQVSFNYFNSPSLYRRDFTTTTPGPINATGTNSLQPTSTNVHSLNYVTCAGTSVTNNPIDGSTYFVQKLYADFLGRDPDQNGLNFWRYNITQCAFDMNCVGLKRVDVARAFFYSGDFIQTHPALGGQRGTHAYNEAFVYACYDGFLRRAPNAPPDNDLSGLIYWTGILDNTNPDAGDGKYNNVINAFLLSTEYRNRF
jgi:hypothetical protein